MTVKGKKKYLPYEIILDRILGKQKVQVPILGGMCDAELIELGFILKNDDSTIVTLLFDDKYKTFCYIDFIFDGMEEVVPEGDFVNEFYERSSKDKFSILEQALAILKDRKEFNKYRRWIERVLNGHNHNKKAMEGMATLTETEKSIEGVIKDRNDLVAYHIEDKSISLHFYDGEEGSEIEFYIDEKGNMQVRTAPTPF
jgi:hypothetical protein